MEPSNKTYKAKSIEELLHLNHTDLMNFISKEPSSKTIKEIKKDILYIEFRKNCKQLSELRMEMVMDDYQKTIQPLLDKLKRRTCKI